VNRIATMLSLAVAVAAPALAYADDPPPPPTPAPAAAPTKDELAQAKKAFEEGNALFKAGKLPEAIEKLKESFRLSRNAFLLYNIGHSYDQLGQKDMVLFYYRKFLSSAPANAPMRDNVAKRVAELEAENVQAATLEGDATANTTASTAPAVTSKYSKADFKHEQIFTVPPGNPIDVTAYVPQDSGYTVKLFFRSTGEAAFTAKPMTWRNVELVARIPAPKVTGSNVQYYLEVRDGSNNLITRSGKSTSPVLVNIENGAQPHYYADFVDEGGEVFVPVTVVEEPLFSSDGQQSDIQPTSKFGTVKWISTGVAAASLGTSLVSFLMAGKEHDKLVSDAHACGMPPCQVFDAEFGQKVEDVGQRWDLVYKITLGVGITTAAVAGYFWYRDLKAHKKRTPTSAWLIVPTVGDSYAGASAAAEF
jgi:hypothetical protein